MITGFSCRVSRRGIRYASTLPEQLTQTTTRRSRTAVASYQTRAHKKQQHLLRSVLAVASVAAGATLWQYYAHDGRILRQAHAETPPQEDNELIFEKSRKQPGASKEDNRDLISSQHHQVKRSWENPGLHAWGNNSGRVVAPQSSEASIKTPRRIPFFDGKLLRDVKLDRSVGVAIDENGDLLEWGTGYAADITEPVRILRGKNLQTLALSRDRIIALSQNGTVYSIPVARADQESGTKALESSWIPFLSSRSSIAYRTIQPSKLGYSEKVSTLAGGLEHVLLLTTAGRVFSAASASDSFPARGQLGVSGLSWHTRPDGDFDASHEITTLKGFDVQQVAAGDYHSVALDKEGRLFSWGDNSAGQLGFDNTAESSLIDVPSLLSIQKLYSGTGQSAKITDIFAGGSNTYFTVDATTMPPMPGRTAPEQEQRLARSVGKVTADTFALGSGISGTLGNNRWTHVQASPAKIPLLSGLFEYDEKDNKTVPIRLSYLSVGDKHVSAVMENITYLSASATSSTDDTNWGADIVFWGNNEFFQIGTGKRNNVSQPVYLQPLDIEAEEKRAKKSSGGREEHRFHITPRTVARLGDGRRKSIEQRVECGRTTTCVYSKA